MRFALLPLAAGTLMLCGLAPPPGGLAPGAVPGAGSGLAPGAGGPAPAPPIAIPNGPAVPQVAPYPFSPAQIAPPAPNAPNGAPQSGPPNFVAVPPSAFDRTGRPQPR